MHPSRVRYLLAMGLSPIGIAVAACHREPNVVPDTNDAARTDAAAVHTASAGSMDEPPPPPPPPPPPTERIVRADAGDGMWTVEVTRDATGPKALPPRPSCPSGAFCVHEPVARPDAAAAAFAPAPFERCAAVVQPAGQGRRIVSFNAQLTERERERVPDACCYSWVERCPGGRPLRDDGRLVVAASVSRADWSGAVGERTDVDAATRRRLAAHWLAEAALEHASVASFARFALSLLALGAPPSLVASAHAAALDEVRHAQDCYALASRYGSEPVGPGPLAIPQSPPPTDPAEVALETLRDGCVGEAIAAHVARAAADGATDADVARILARIAEDETTHAELAFRTVAWLLAEHGAPVRAVIEQVLAELDVRTAHPPPRANANGDARHGVLSDARRAELAGEAIRSIVAPCLRALLDANAVYATLTT